MTHVIRVDPSDFFWGGGVQWLLHDDWNHAMALSYYRKYTVNSFWNYVFSEISFIDGMVLRALQELAAPSAGQLKAFKIFKAPNANRITSTLERVTRPGDFLSMAVGIWNC